MTKKGPKTIILSGYGINCERETAYAFERAGAEPKILHLNDLISYKKHLDNCNILVFPGGFSMGDDTGSGLAYANMIRNHLDEEIEAFRQRDTLALGICNGFQIMTHLGFFPVSTEEYGTPETSLVFNSNARYRDLWVDLFAEPYAQCIWTEGLGFTEMPVAHGEGRFYATTETLARLENNGQVAIRYVDHHNLAGDAGSANPNGSANDIGGICDQSGRFLGMMPHPERAVLSIQDPRFFTKEYIKRRNGGRINETNVNMRIFNNAVKYFE